MPLLPSLPDPAHLMNLGARLNVMNRIIEG
jgi:hypothetical protein